MGSVTSVTGLVVFGTITSLAAKTGKEIVVLRCCMRQRLESVSVEAGANPSPDVAGQGSGTHRLQDLHRPEPPPRNPPPASPLLRAVYEIDGTGRDGLTKTFEKPWFMTACARGGWQKARGPWRWGCRVRASPQASHQPGTHDPTYRVCVAARVPRPLNREIPPAP